MSRTDDEGLSPVESTVPAIQRTIQSSSAHPIKRLADARLLRKWLGEQEAAWVRQVRDEGYSWDAIAEAMGLSRPAVVDRYGASDSGRWQRGKKHTCRYCGFQSRVAMLFHAEAVCHECAVARSERGEPLDEPPAGGPPA
jgi:hypothetical protein